MAEFQFQFQGPAIWGLSHCHGLARMCAADLSYTTLNCEVHKQNSCFFHSAHLQSHFIQSYLCYLFSECRILKTYCRTTFASVKVLLPPLHGICLDVNDSLEILHKSLPCQPISNTVCELCVYFVIDPVPDADEILPLTDFQRCSCVHHSLWACRIFLHSLKKWCCCY